MMFKPKKIKAKVLCKSTHLFHIYICIDYFPDMISFMFEDHVIFNNYSTKAKLLLVNIQRNESLSLSRIIVLV